ncbi:MAG TPA: serine/threonine-protein kinase [Pseudomonadota bacterium]|nr:serine/threonine-protein kinase [Pseudomonadota bacterium]
MVAKAGTSSSLGEIDSTPPAEVEGYEIRQQLGRGAFGTVWLGVQKNTGKQVAIKFYAHSDGLDLHLLRREVESLAFLYTERDVVQLLAVGWEHDPPFYVMEYLPHGSLEDRLRNGPLPISEAVHVAKVVARALGNAHGRGILHCDLKPANVLFDGNGKPRLCDFGQARLSTDQKPSLGTFFYMAPEQADLLAVPDAGGMCMPWVRFCTPCSRERRRTETDPWSRCSVEPRRCPSVCAYIGSFCCAARRLIHAITVEEWTRLCAKSSHGVWRLTRLRAIPMSRRSFRRWNAEHECSSDDLCFCSERSDRLC